MHPQSADLVIASVVGAANARAGGPDLQDEDDHGTPVASIIGAAKDNLAVHGVAPEAQLLIFRTDDDGMEEESLFGAAIVEGIIRSANIGAGVVNLSLGTDEAGARADFADMLNFATDNDIFVAISAGNDSMADPDESALGALDVAGDTATIIVGAVRIDGAIAGFSNRAGIAADIFLAAPGVLVPTIGNDTTPSQTEFFSGTSAATPHVAGAAALIRGMWPQLTAREVAAVLLDSATDLGAAGTDPIFGRGLLNVGAAVEPLGMVMTTSISGASTEVADLNANLSSAFGSSLEGLADIVVFDKYEPRFPHGPGRRD